APVKDMGETVQRLTQARELHEDMAQFARRHKAQDAQVSQGDATAGMKAQNDAIKGGAKSTANPSPEMTRPDLVLASAAGIAVTASDSTHLHSQNDHAITAGRDVSIASGRSWLASVRGALSFVTGLGIRLFAAKGKVEIQAQSDAMALGALKDLTISSTNGRIIITAAKEIWIGAGGSYIQINGSGIVNGSPGPILEKTSKWSKSGVDSMKMRLLAMPTSESGFDDRFQLIDQKTKTPLANVEYAIVRSDGAIEHGVTDEQGHTHLLSQTATSESVAIYA
ncbi:DUF2345 domain-containing protein, partial [Paraburkholderia phymatum]